MSNTHPKYNISEHKEPRMTLSKAFQEKDHSSVMEADVSVTSSLCSPSEQLKEPKKNKSNINLENLTEKCHEESMLQINFPPPNPLPSQAECLLSDPSKITIKFTYRQNNAKKHNISFFKDSNDLNNSMQQHISFENNRRENENRIGEAAIMQDLLNPTSLSALYDIEKRNL
jgi:hypothetical protein